MVHEMFDDVPVDFLWIFATHGRYVDFMVDFVHHFHVAFWDAGFGFVVDDEIGDVVFGDVVDGLLELGIEHFEQGMVLRKVVQEHLDFAPAPHLEIVHFYIGVVSPQVDHLVVEAVCHGRA